MKIYTIYIYRKKYNIFTEKSSIYRKKLCMKMTVLNNKYYYPDVSTGYADRKPLPRFAELCRKSASAAARVSQAFAANVAGGGRSGSRAGAGQWRQCGNPPGDCKGEALSCFSCRGRSKTWHLQNWAKGFKLDELAWNFSFFGGNFAGEEEARKAFAK